MRRLAIALLTCLGLTLALVGPAGAAKPQPLGPLQITSLTAVPVTDLPTLCLAQLEWTTAPEPRKGSTFLFYAISASVDPNAPWGELADQRSQDTSATWDIPLRNDGTTWYFNVAAYYQTKMKGKQVLVSTPFDTPADVVASC